MDENKFFEIEATGRNGVEKMLAHYEDQLWALRPSFIKDEARKAYFTKLMANISNEDNLKPLFQSRKGLFTLYKTVSKAVELGLNIGGVRPHAYILPYGETASLIPSADGYRFVVTAGENPIFREVDHGIVRKGDSNFKIDESNGLLEHPINPLEERGEMLGVWVRGLPFDKDLPNKVKFIGKDRILQIRDNHSRMGKQNKGPWARS